MNKMDEQPKPSSSTCDVNTRENNEATRQTVESEDKEANIPALLNRSLGHWSKVRQFAKIRSVLNTRLARSDTFGKRHNARRDSFMERFSNLRHGSQISPSDSGSLNNQAAAGQLTDHYSVQNLVSSRMHAVAPNPSPDFPTELLEDHIKMESMKNISCGLPFIFHPLGRKYLVWLTFVSIAVLYNLWTVIAREAFEELVWYGKNVWIALDIISDLVYILDFVVQFGTTYLECGLTVVNRKMLAMRYVKSSNFILDILSLVPLDMLQIYLGSHPILRFPRFIKSYRAREWKIKIENRSVYPNMWRLVNLIHFLFLGCHWFASFYFMLSRLENFSTEWGFQPDPKNNTHIYRKYLKSFYWATVALTTIGIQDGPTTTYQYAFTIMSYMMGLFIFATVVGQVTNIIEMRTAARNAFEEMLDNAKSYMRANHVRPDLTKRVLRWYDYAWYKNHFRGCADVNAIEMLPIKLKTELALNVNLETLKRVTIFKECEPEFLHDLVLKMRLHVFTPGDYICREGEIAREMFIIADGVLEIVGPNEEVLYRMFSGDFFGEIGILNLDGVNKRTADVRAVGYVDVFVLSMDDVLSALKDHPEAEAVIKQYAIQRLLATRNVQSGQRQATSSEPSDANSSEVYSQQKQESMTTNMGKLKPNREERMPVSSLKVIESTAMDTPLAMEDDECYRKLPPQIVEVYETQINELIEENNLLKS